MRIFVIKYKSGSMATYVVSPCGTSVGFSGLVGEIDRTIKDLSSAPVNLDWAGFCGENWNEVLHRTFRSKWLEWSAGISCKEYSLTDYDNLTLES